MIDGGTPSFGMLKMLWGWITKKLFIDAYRQSESAYLRSMQLGVYWQSLGDIIEYDLRLENIFSNRNPPLSYITVRSSDSKEYNRVVINITARKGAMSYQDTVVFINVNKMPSIAALPSIPLMNYWATEHGVDSSYEDVCAELLEIEDISGENVKHSRIRGQRMHPVPNVLNEGIDKRWGRFWNLGEITEQKHLIRTRIKFHRYFMDNVHAHQAKSHWPSRLLYLVLTRDYIVNIVFWSRNMIRATQLRKAIEKEEAELKSSHAVYMENNKRKSKAEIVD